MGLKPKFFRLCICQKLCPWWFSKTVRAKGRQWTSGAEHQQPGFCSWFPEQPLSDLKEVISPLCQFYTCRAMSTSSCTEWSSIPDTPKSHREFWEPELLLLFREQNLCQKCFRWNKRPGDKELVKIPPPVLSQVCSSVCIRVSLPTLG